MAPLGSGGMGEVYRARDARLRRDVALKVLSASRATDPDAQARFEREARAVAALSHPNILAIYDFGSHEGVVYAVMELVEGETLRSRLDGGSLSQRKAIDVGVQIAQGLAAAHEKGIVHRDLKPENVIITWDGRVKVLDFGLARLLHSPGALGFDETSTDLQTRDGLVLGTVSYMSPEQVRGLPADHRSDIFACGVVLYEMLTGRRPFGGDSAVETMNAILKEDPPSLVGSAAPIAASLRRIVERCVEKAPAERFQSARDLAFGLEALRTLSDSAASARPDSRVPRRVSASAAAALAIVALAAILGVALVAGRGRSVAVKNAGGAASAQGNVVSSTSGAGLQTDATRNADDRASVTVPPPAQASLAVLPFQDLSVARDQDYFADGLAEDIVTQLAKVPALRLVGRGSSFSFRGENEDLRVIGEKLGVANLLEGSIRKDGNRLRITAQLSRSADGTQLWSNSYDREVRDVFAVQDEIAREVAQALSVKLDVVTLNRAQGGTTNLEAYDRFLRWRQLYFSERRGVEVSRERVRLMREAVARDPGFVLAWDALAESLLLLAAEHEHNEGHAGKLREEAAQVRRRLSALAPDSWIVKRERAYGLWREGKRSEAIALAEEIMKAGPLTVEHAYPYISLIFSAGRLEETIQLMARLQAIEPLVMFVSRDQQWNLTAGRRFDEAAAEYQRSLRLDGSLIEPSVIAFLRMLARNDGDLKALRKVYDGTVEAQSQPYWRDLRSLLDDRQAMLALVRKAHEDIADPGVIQLADALGDADLALAALRKFLRGKPEYAAYWHAWIAPYSGMRALPGFKDLMREVGLVDHWRESGVWGDACKPVGQTDFVCQ